MPFLNYTFTVNDSLYSSHHALTMYRWTALASGLVCLTLAPLLESYVPGLVDPWILRTVVGTSYLVSLALSFVSTWVKENFQILMLGLTYAVTAWLIYLNHLNNFTPPLAYAVFELLIGGSIAFVSLRSLSVYLAATCITTALLLQNITNPELHVEMYISSLAVVAILVLLVNYWRSKLLEDAQESSLLMQSVFSNSADGLFLLRSGLLEKASAQGLSMLNASNQEELEEHLADLIDNRSAYYNCSTDVHITNETGLNLWVEIVVTDAGGNNLELMRLTDIGDRKQAELELTQAATTAESALRSRRDFLTTISHELRTPLNGVIGASRLLALEHEYGKDADLIHVIERSGRSLLASIDNIIAYAEMDSGDLALREETLSAKDCVIQAVACIQEQADAKQLTVNIDCQDAAANPRTGDIVRITQLLELLLNNAVKFTKDGSVEVKVSVADEHNPELLTFEVTDTGIGIEPELRDHIFDSFTQADASDARQHGGIGLGLAICSRLVTRLGGRLGCRSVLGQGSTFYFTLPLPGVTRVGAATSLPTIEEPEATTIQSAAVARVLLVEDNVMNQKITLRMLAKLGYQADLAEDGCEAITACQSQHYDLILMDLQMPNMGGLEATVVLRGESATERTPIIALTANAQASDRERCLSAGMNDFLAKPATLDLLEERLQHHLAAAS